MLSGGLDILLEAVKRDADGAGRGEFFAAELSVGLANEATDWDRFRIATLLPGVVEGPAVSNNVRV